MSNNPLCPVCGWTIETLHVFRCKCDILSCQCTIKCTRCGKSEFLTGTIGDLRNTLFLQTQDAIWNTTVEHIANILHITQGTGASLIRQCLLLELGGSPEWGAFCPETEDLYEIRELISPAYRISRLKVPIELTESGAVVLAELGGVHYAQRLYPAPGFHLVSASTYETSLATKAQIVGALLTTE